MNGKISWWGHAAVELIGGDGAVIFVDPWLSNPAGGKTVDDVKRVDGICITHDHFDHVGDTVELCSRFQPAIACQPEVAAGLKEQGVSESRFVGGGIGMNVGGGVKIAGHYIIMTQALHSAARGTAGGFVIIAPGGYTIYHAGDTSVFSDMALIGRLYGVDLAILPIGGHFTMGPRQAAEAVRLIGPKAVMPVHYGTFPLLEPDTGNFRRELEAAGVKPKLMDMEPGVYCRLD